MIFANFFPPPLILLEESSDREMPPLVLHAGALVRIRGLQKVEPVEPLLGFGNIWAIGPMNVHEETTQHSDCTKNIHGDFRIFHEKNIVRKKRVSNQQKATVTNSSDLLNVTIIGVDCAITEQDQLRVYLRVHELV